MENITYNKTDETPLIIFNTDGTLRIEGVSIPENVLKFYSPIMDWLTEFNENLPQVIHLTLRIEYMNTSSTRIMADILRKLKSFQVNGTQVIYTWIHDNDDDDSIELGEDLEFMAGVKFIFTPLT